MQIAPLLVLIGWIPLGAFLFSRLPVRVAIFANFFVGWAILPGAAYTPSTATFPYWILGVCLPTQYFLTKATVPAFAALAGIFLFHRHSPELLSFRLGWRDLPMILWCCAPLISAAGHTSTVQEALFGSIYQTISWGVPWFLGRIYISDRNSKLMAAKVFVIAALCYIPVCLIELCSGPRLYALLYGFQPYRFIGAERYLGFRPIGLLEDGNQLGIWMAAGTLIAIALSVQKLVPRILGLPMGWAAAALAATTLACQSIGSILLLLALLPLTLLKQRSLVRAAIAALVLGIVSFALFRMNDLVSLRALSQRNPTVHFIATELAAIGRNSLTWRLARDEGHMKVALLHPILGSGHWNWWQDGDVRPWSLWLLIFGMYGLVGLSAFASILFLPVIRTIWTRANENDLKQSALSMALVALILMIAFDDLLNGAMMLPVLLVMGGLVSRVALPTSLRESFHDKPPLPLSS